MFGRRVPAPGVPRCFTSQEPLMIPACAVCEVVNNKEQLKRMACVCNGIVASSLRGAPVLPGLIGDA
ncbi:hypothetical protein [Dyadobacter sp. NIV53]|uniref:hypothetical protein n=1 Tax=Dyadobacter sp. NIV53 TaxID=2861765 RepID=UPI001C877AC8|nr:hypothetical protein [Dyadobacter sp. NIV53]